MADALDSKSSIQKMCGFESLLGQLTFLSPQATNRMYTTVHYLHIGGVVAVGFDSKVAYLLVISHSGRGVFSTETWLRVSRSYDLAYPVDGIALGIGPIEGEQVSITEMNYETGVVTAISPDGRFALDCVSCGITVSRIDTMCIA